MKRTLMIATIAAVSFLGATAASAQTIRSTLASDDVRFSSMTYLPGQGGCVDDQGFAWKNVCE